jgi:hypothetical protein
LVLTEEDGTMMSATSVTDRGRSTHYSP